MINVGIIGMGMMGGAHAPQYLRHPNAKLVALADQRPERRNADEALAGNIKELAGTLEISEVERFAEGHDLIAETDVDVIDVCLPTYLHPEYVIAALESGRHVLCEKPMALTPQLADEMIAAAEANDRYLMVGQCLRFWPEYQVLHDAVENETYGELRSLNMYRHGGLPIWSWNNWYLDEARSGGMILDLHIHDTDYVNYLLGTPDTIQAVGQHHERGGYRIVHACYSYDDGPQVHMHAGWSPAQIPFRMGFDAWFERGFLRYENYAQPTLKVFKNFEAAEAELVEFEPGSGYYNEIAYFLDCIENETPPTTCPPQSARDSVALIHREIDAIENS